MNLNTHFKGRATELKVATAFLNSGIMISEPLVPQSCKYDFIAEVNKRLYKIQVKTDISKDDNYIDFATRTSHTNCNRTINKGYSNIDVDYFATEHNGKCYLVPFNKCASTEQRLRLTETPLHNHCKILYAKDYLLEDMIDKIASSDAI